MEEDVTARSPRLCYLVLSHREPVLVQRLVASLTDEDPDCRVLVRHDATVVGLDEGLNGDRVRVIQSEVPARWGTWALTKASLEGVQAALDLEWDWVVLVSGQSYPLMPPRVFAESLRSLEEGGVFDLSRGEQGSRDGFWTYRSFGADRARYNYFDLPYTPLWEGRWLRKVLASASGRQPFVGFAFHDRGPRKGRTHAQVAVYSSRSVFARGAVPLKAGQWWALKREHATSLMELLAPSNNWNRHFRRSFISDELAIPSFLAARGVQLSDHAIHAQYWPSGPSPRTLGMQDWPWLEDQQAPFVRKVSLEEGSELLDRIDVRRRAGLTGRPGTGKHP